MPSPREVIISITNRCNFKCRMCDIAKNKIAELSTAQWKQVIKDAALCGSRTIVFSGGEPLLREDIFELISYTKNNSMGACLTSNGYLIQDGIADKLQKAMVDVVNISMEGPKPVHDYLRGKGMFEKAVSALENLRKHKIETTIATMVSRYNYKYLSYIVEFAKDYGATTIKFQPFSRIFLDNRDGIDGFLTYEREIEKLTGIMQDVISRSNNYSIATNPSGYLETIPFYLGKKYINSNYGCVALENSCPINCNGDIYPCWVIADKDSRIGNIKENSFLNLWNSPKRKSTIEKIKEEGCPGCMMSCYDDNFGKESIERRIIMNVGRLRKKGVRGYTRGVLKKFIRRLKFYSSYRGSFKGILNRFCGSVLKKEKLKLKLEQEEIDAALKEIELAKQILKEELRS